MGIALLKDVITPLIGIAALLFTIGTFWWNNWRRGRITVAVPGTYGAHQDGETTRLLLPLAFSNSGPVPIAVISVRAVVCNEAARGVLEFTTTRTAMKLDPGVDWVYASNFVVDGRSIELRHCEFVGLANEAEPLRPGSNTLRIEILPAHVNKWVHAGTFAIHIPPHKQQELRTRYLIYGNSEALP